MGKIDLEECIKSKECVEAAGVAGGALERVMRATSRELYEAANGQTTIQLGVMIGTLGMMLGTYRYLKRNLHPKVVEYIEAVADEICKERCRADESASQPITAPGNADWN